MQILRHQSIHTLLDIDTFSPSSLFTLVNNNTSTITASFDQQLRWHRGDLCMFLFISCARHTKLCSRVSMSHTHVTSVHIKHEFSKGDEETKPIDVCVNQALIYYH